VSVTVTLPEVASCDVVRCAYNDTRGVCRAPAVTIGNAIPHCDTYHPQAVGHSLGGRRLGAGVGACKSRGCRHNEDLACTADQVQVGADERGGLCLTKTP